MKLKMLFSNFVEITLNFSIEHKFTYISNNFYDICSISFSL